MNYKEIRSFFPISAYCSVTGAILQKLRYLATRVHWERIITPASAAGPSMFMPIRENAWVQGDTHDPSTPIRGHVTEDFQCLGLVTIQVNGIEARCCVSIQHGLGAVLGEWIQESNCKIRREVKLREADWWQLNCFLVRFLWGSNLASLSLFLFCVRYRCNLLCGSARKITSYGHERFITCPYSDESHLLA